MRFFCSLIFCICCLATLHTAQAQTCNANMSASTQDSQLTDNGDGTITDSATGLMWKKCLEGVSGDICDSGDAGSFTWQTALQQAGLVNGGGGFAGHQDWRLPNIKELVSLVEEKCYDPSINLNRFPNTPSSVVWSGSPSVDYPDSVRIVFFYNGVSTSGGNRTGSNLVRLVRGGQ
ncbi:MAG: DUF1566 domain-containing protein [Proteobacteria bacterium]|nr:DUF1566 domain-containing protein [Pseudomonadota bacterium]MBU1057914.1 DUF1566 domain-containing protein [Pseudomonadota bacterium]